MKMIAVSSAVILTMLTGCQSTHSNQIDSTNEKGIKHPSFAVYNIEKQAAADLKQQAEELALLSERYCASDNLSLSELQASWRKSQHLWMHLQGQERGPQEALSLGWSIQFWPDKKNTTGRKMSALVKSGKSYRAAELLEQSVTVQGLSALEWLFFDVNSPAIKQDTNAACRLLPAVTQAFETNAGTINAAWQTNPWLSMDDSAWTAEYIALMNNQLEYAISKFVRPMANIGKPRPYFAESWRSKQSLTNLKFNLQALRSLYLADGSGLDNRLRELGYVDLADRVLSQFDSIINGWPDHSDLFDSLQTKPGYRDALLIKNKLDQLKYLMHDEVAVELGVVIGFNSTDGD